MAEGLDRVGIGRSGARDPLGKSALYSTAPTESPLPLVYVRCRSCDVERSLRARDALTLLRPPWFVLPPRRAIWTRCPSCDRRAWLDVRAGDGVRRLWERPPE